MLGNQARGKFGRQPTLHMQKQDAGSASGNAPPEQKGTTPSTPVEAQKNSPIKEYPEYNYWTRSKEFKGNKVYQRDDLFDPHQVDKDGLTNIQRMKQGKAPQCSEKKPINLHHMIQRHDGAIAEVTHTMHTKDSKILHINSNKTPSGINRKEFERWRKQYWRDRAKDFEGDTQ